jgi:hypothetical protein
MAAILMSSVAASVAAPSDVSGPSTGRAEIFRLAPDPADVHRIQGLLFDLGLYDGPLDGELSAATDRAVVAFQHLSGRPADGWIDDTLIARLAAEAARAGPGRRLERTRIEDRERARRLLDGLGFTRAYFAAVGQPPALDEAFCRTEPALRCLLAEARSSAEAIARQDVRDGALGGIADVHIRAGQGADAFNAVALMEDPRLVLAALRRLALARAEVEHGPLATALARLLEEAPPERQPSTENSGAAAVDDARRRALSYIGLAAGAGEARPAEAGAILARAIAAAGAIERPYARAYALYRIGVVALGLGDGDNNVGALAEKVASQIDHRQVRAALLWHIAADRRRRAGSDAAETAEVAALAATASVAGTLSRAWLLADASELYAVRGQGAVAADILRLAVAEGSAITTAAERAQAFTRLAAARATLDRAGEGGR